MTDGIRRSNIARVDKLVEMTSGEFVVDPACAEHENQELVDRAVVHIRSLLASTVSRGIREVGNYLLEHFYQNDPALYAAWGSKNHASLRLLEQRCETLELPVSRTFLSNALRIAVITRKLPASSKFLELPVSHRVELLKVGNEERIEQLAERALDGTLSVRKLRSLVEKEKRKYKSNRGRRPTPPVLLAVTHCVRELRDQETGRLAFKRDDIAQLDEHQHAELVEQFESLRKRVEELGRLLG